MGMVRIRPARNIRGWIIEHRPTSISEALNWLANSKWQHQAWEYLVGNLPPKLLHRLLKQYESEPTTCSAYYYVRHRMIRALIPACKDCVLSATASPVTRAAALRALYCLTDRVGIIKNLCLGWVGSERTDQCLTAAAAAALCRMGDPRGWEFLCRCLDISIHKSKDYYSCLINGIIVFDILMNDLYKFKCSTNFKNKIIEWITKIKQYNKSGSYQYLLRELSNYFKFHKL